MPLCPTYSYQLWELFRSLLSCPSVPRTVINCGNCSGLCCRAPLSHVQLSIVGTVQVSVVVPLCPTYSYQLWELFRFLLSCPSVPRAVINCGNCSGLCCRVPLSHVQLSIVRIVQVSVVVFLCPSCSCQLRACFDRVLFSVECGVSRTVSQPFACDLMTRVSNRCTRILNEFLSLLVSQSSQSCHLRPEVITRCG